MTIKRRRDVDGLSLGEEHVDTARAITAERQDFGCYGHGKPYPIPDASAIVGRMQTGIFDSLKESAHRQHPSPGEMWSNDILRAYSSASRSPALSPSSAACLENLGSGRKVHQKDTSSWSGAMTSVMLGYFIVCLYF